MKNLKIKTSFIVVGLLSTALVLSCKKESEITTAECSATISYATDIAPLMSQSCTGCHNSSNAQGGYNLTTHGNVSNDASVILKSMRHSGGVDPMPQGSSKLATSVVDKFDCWIQQGKQNN